MSNLQKFKQTLEDLNQEVEKFKDVSEAYMKLRQLVETFEENSKTLNTINERLESEQDNISQSLAGIESVNKQNKNELTKLIEEKTDKIRTENKEFYRDIESTIKIKLDDNKSQIKQLIEGERNQIKQIFEIEFAKNSNDLKKFIENEANEIAKNQRASQISVWIICGLTLILSALMIFKIWTI